MQVNACTQRVYVMLNLFQHLKETLNPRLPDGQEVQGDLFIYEFPWPNTARFLRLNKQAQGVAPPVKQFVAHSQNPHTTI